MKNLKKNVFLIKFVAMVTLVACLSSCEKQIDNNNDLSQIERTGEDKIMYEYLVNDLKLNPEDIEEDENAFYYQECIEYNKADFFGSDGISSRKNQKLGTTIDAIGETGSVRVTYDSSLPSAWVTAFDRAIPEWNGRDGHISFEKDDGGSLGTITITYEPVGTSTTFARASKPIDNGSGKMIAGPTIKVNSNYSGDPLFAKHKLKTAVHELGHCVGLGHTDKDDAQFLYTGNSSCDNQTEGDGFMRQGRIEYSGFSTCDAAAYEALYERVFIMASNSKYLCSENGNVNAIANRDKLQVWEKFKLKKNTSDNSYNILGSNGKYADVNRGAGYYLQFSNGDKNCGDCKFFIDKIKNTKDIYSIRFGNRYLSSKGGSEPVKFDAFSVGNNEKWRIFKLVDCKSGVCPTTFN